MLASAQVQALKDKSEFSDISSDILFKIYMTKNNSQLDFFYLVRKRVLEFIAQENSVKAWFFVFKTRKMFS